MERLLFAKYLNENNVLNLKMSLDLLVAGEKDLKHTKLVFGTTSSTIKSMK